MKTVILDITNGGELRCDYKGVTIVDVLCDKYSGNPKEISGDK